MAESAVTVLLDKLVTLLEEEVKLLRGVRREVEFIKGELECMLAFLRDADGREGSDDGVKAWVKQVRDVAYDTEDILDEFKLRLEKQCRRHGFFGFLHKTAHFIKHLKASHQITKQIQDVKSRVCQISERRHRYHFNSLEQGSSSNSMHDSWHDLRGDALLIQEDKLVGIDNSRNELIELLVEGESRLGVVSVVGIGGLGKTTLVKNVYDDQRFKGYFHHHAWVTVSQSFKIEELLRDMIVQLFQEIMQAVPQGLDVMKDTRLKMILKEFLQQKRYVIVFDDLWSIHAWEALKYALPDSNCGSRIMVTTRNADIASSCIESYGHVYNLQPLNQAEAWVLFCKKAFRSNLENTCPLELEKLSQNILRRCEGLPLAIVAIGGLLSTKDKTLIEWLSVHDHLGAHLESNDKLRSMKKVLLLSFIDLPHYLKSCFLYLSIFPEDYAIERMKIIRLWIAEGFIEEKEGNSTVEEVAENYLKELINRNLIQVKKTEIDGSVRSCQVHDILRDFIISKSQEQNFATLVVQTNSRLNEKIRRLSIHSSVENVLEIKNLSHLRSLFLFGTDKLPNSLISDIFTGRFRLLRVLDLVGASSLEIFPSEIVNLISLRYLSLRSTKIKTLPNSIGKLLNLETLDLKQTYVSELPVEILKLKNLRHLLVYRYEVESYVPFDSKRGFKAFMGIGGLVSLQKLSIIEASQGSGIVRELGSLSQLRRLGIIKLRREDGIDLCSSIQKMSNLRCLDVTSIDEEEILDLHSLSSLPPLLQRLYMRGRLETLPHWIPTLNNLVNLSLRWSRLRDDPLEALQALPNLLELGLHEACEGEELCFKAGGFKRLKLFSLNKLEGLKLVRMEGGALPSLEALYIQRCGALEELPLGIERLTRLRELFFFDMPNEFCSRLPPNIGQDHWKVAHILDVRLIYWTDGGWKYYCLPAHQSCFQAA